MYEGFNPNAFTVMSYGPDQHQDGAEHYIRCYKFGNCGSSTNAGDRGQSLLYHSTNGLISSGDIARTGGESGTPTVIGG